jgi:C4-dicarboxylate transporter, DctM subunit
VKTKLLRALDNVERYLAIGILFVMSALPIAEITGREIWGRGIAGSIPLLQYLTLWITFAGAAVAARSGRLLTLATPNLLPEKVRRWAGVLTSAMATGITGCLLFGSLHVVRTDWESGAFVAGPIPVWAATAAIPLGLGVIAARFIWNASSKWSGRVVVTGGLAIPVLFGIVQTLPAWTLPVGLILVAGSAVLGLPIFVAIAGAALLLFWGDGIGPAAVAEQARRLSTAEALPVIPLYTFAGFLLAEGGSGKRLFRFLSALTGWLPGSLAIVSVLLLAFFTPLTGASGVTILSLGGLILPLMTKAGYPEKSSIGLVTVSGSIGLLFPPSVPVILFAIYAHTPIPELFLGALIPGALLVAVVALWGARQGWLAGAGGHVFSFQEARSAMWAAKWDLLMPVVIIGGIFGGFTSAIEAAAVTVMYAMIVECGIHRSLEVKRDIPRIAVECATLVGGFLIVLAVALGFTNYLDYADAPVHALNWVRTHVESRIVFLLTLNIFLLIVGALMDIYSAILVVVPLIIPISAAYGINPVHLGVIFLTNMELGYLMPPMGENLFLASLRFNQPLSRIYLSTLPYLLLILAVVLLVTFVPALTLAPAGLK